MAELTIEHAHAELLRQHPHLFAFLKSAGKKKRKTGASSSSSSEYDEADNEYPVQLASALESVPDIVLESIVTRLPYRLIEAMCRASFRLAYYICGRFPETGDLARTRKRREQIGGRLPQPAIWKQLLARDFGLADTVGACTIEYELARERIARSVKELILPRLGDMVVRGDRLEARKAAERQAKGYKRLYESLLLSAASTLPFDEAQSGLNNTQLIKVFGYYELTVYGCYRGLVAVRMRYTSSRTVSDTKNDLYILPLPCILTRFARTRQGDMVAAILDEDDEPGFVAEERISRIRAYLTRWSLYTERDVQRFNLEANPFVYSATGNYFMNAILPASTPDNTLYTEAGLYLGEPDARNRVEAGERGFVAYDSQQNAKDALKALGLIDKDDRLGPLLIQRLARAITGAIYTDAPLTEPVWRFATIANADDRRAPAELERLLQTVTAEANDRLLDLRTNVALPTLGKYADLLANQRLTLLVSKNGTVNWAPQAMPVGDDGKGPVAIGNRFYASVFVRSLVPHVFVHNRATRAVRLLRLGFAQNSREKPGFLYNSGGAVARQFYRLYIDNDNDALHIMLFTYTADRALQLVWSTVGLASLFFDQPLQPSTVTSSTISAYSPFDSYTLRPFDGFLVWLTGPPTAEQTKALVLHIDTRKIYYTVRDDQQAGADYHWTSRRYWRQATHNVLPSNVAVQTELVDQLKEYSTRQAALMTGQPGFRVQLLPV